MLSRTRSIFYIEEEAERDETGDGDFAAETGGVVGLQILIKRGGTDSKVLTKSSMKKKKKKKKRKAVLAQLSADFLERCFLCGKELSLQEEVYMYRGDQGFCSVECRHKQILADERKEVDSSRRLRFMQAPNHQHQISTIQESSGRSKISVAA